MLFRVGALCQEQSFGQSFEQGRESGLDRVEFEIGFTHGLSWQISKKQEEKAGVLMSVIYGFYKKSLSK